MQDGLRSEPFATAEFQRTAEFFRQTQRVFYRQQRSRWFSRVAAILFLIFGPLLILRGSPAGWVLLAAVVVIEGGFWYLREKWIRNRLATVPKDDPGMRIQFRDDTMLISCAESISEVNWQGIYGAKREPEGLLILIKRQGGILVPMESIQSADAMATILQKANEKSGAVKSGR